MNIKIRNSYITKEFIINLFFSFSIFAFIFSLRALLKIFEILSKGTFSPLAVSTLFLLTFITTFNIIIPLTYLYSSMALFARLSIDRELLIFSSSGVMPIKLISPVLFFSTLGTIFLILINLYVIPYTSYIQRDIIQSLKFRNPLTLIQEKNVIDDIPGITIYVGKVSRNFKLQNIAITQKEDDTTNFLSAEKGEVTYNPIKNLLIFKLENGSLVSYGVVKDVISNLNFQNYTFTFSLPSHFRYNPVKTKISEKPLKELISQEGIDEKIELQKRIVLGITPLVFIFLGAGLGRKIKQKSKMLHIGLGGIIGVLFLQIVFVGELLARKTGLILFVWTSILVSVIVNILLWKKKC